MRLRSEADVQEFLDAVSQCGGDVYLKSPEGDIFNLKSSMSRYIAIGTTSILWPKQFNSKLKFD